MTFQFVLVIYLMVLRVTLIDFSWGLHFSVIFILYAGFERNSYYYLSILFYIYKLNIIFIYFTYIFNAKLKYTLQFKHLKHT